MRGLLPALTQIINKPTTSLKTPLWTVTQITGEMNHRVYHCQSRHDEQRDLMVKLFDHTDERRAWREYSALRSLSTLGIFHVAPAPLFLLEGYVQPDIDVVITEWLPTSDIPLGETLNKMQWTTILQTLAEIHAINASNVRVKLTDSLCIIKNPIDYLDRLETTFKSRPQIADRALLAFIDRVLVHLRQTLPSQWMDDTPTTLIHGDWQLHNFAFSDGAVRFFDWEMAGWGDPAMDIATLLAHEAFADVSPHDQKWLIDSYQSICDDESLARRVDIYAQLLDIYWLIRTATQRSAKPSDRIDRLLRLYRERIARRYHLPD